VRSDVPGREEASEVRVKPMIQEARLEGLAQLAV